MRFIFAVCISVLRRSMGVSVAWAVLGFRNSRVIVSNNVFCIIWYSSFFSIIVEYN
ncbi:membrane protein [Candidatus Thiomargarita nelsonii]|uniref:Membrane protein n=1 Tax=Candidatus Thiomargarita nelsonii TaxID=1003181 RepID=A0A176RX94_9GAMM|nr:membrane protein [Candidatus Thiomargarita nelsonii]